MGDRAIILIPPSEGKAPGGDGPGWEPASGRFAALAAERAKVAKALGTAARRPRAEAERLLGVRGATLDRARAANRAVVGAPTLPAHERYRGVVHDHIGFGSLAGVARERAAEEVVIVSALLGLVGVDDPVPDHRLKMNVALGRLGRLSRWWRPALAAVLDPLLHDHVVVDLLPGEHADAWPVAAASGRRGPVRVSFEEVGPGGVGRRASGHAAKAVKGRLVGHLLARPGDVADALTSFTADGWRLDDAAGTSGGDGVGRRAVYVRG